MSLPYHYPTELLQLLAKTVAVLCKSKRDVLLFFSSAGVPKTLLAPHERILKEDAEQFKKQEVAKALLYHLNRNDEAYIRERREIIKRVVEWENFDSCWPSDRDRAVALVHEVRRVLNVKDSFTRMSQERDQEAAEKRAATRAELEKKAERKEEWETLRRDLGALFGDQNAHRRGRSLESVLNRVFGHYGMLVCESFERRDPEGGCLEQLDGVIRADSHLWLVEMKWHKEALGPQHVNSHIMRAFGRGEARALLVSASGYTDAAVAAARDANAHRLCLLFELREIVECLDKEANLAEVLHLKEVAATVDKNPMYRALAYMG